MTTHHARIAFNTASGTSLPRADAARILRELRNVSAFELTPALRFELIEWIEAALPDHRLVRRRKIDALRQAGHLDAAQSLIARGLLEQPRDPHLMLRRAEVLIELSRFGEAQRELSHVLHARPHWGRALAVQAEVALHHREPRRAVELFRAALRRCPDRDPIRHRLARQLIEIGALDDAEAVLNAIPDADPRLHLRLMRERGDAVGALQLIDLLLPDAQEPLASDLWRERIELIERSGDRRRLTIETKAILGRSDLPPRVHARAIESLIVLGRPHAATARAARLSHEHPTSPEAWQVLLTAAAASDRSDLARQALGRLGQIRELPAPDLAPMWRRAIIGRLLARAYDAAETGADPSTSVLRPLLEDASAVLSESIDASGGGSADIRDLQPDADERRQMHALCLAALGRRTEAARQLAASAAMGTASDSSAAVSRAA